MFEISADRRMSLIAWADYSHSCPHRVNMQLVTDPTTRPQWVSPAPPTRAHGLTAARTHREQPDRQTPRHPGVSSLTALTLEPVPG